ncbi:hypothetical protein SCHPADRAFT_828687 [Schizopora paradoxa]|uniref:Uncharacterized protein n=1 Tax=Schizopora paradoxa TaxID=27342 RepID=A0A0H2RM91_9AGAM|nr:hypothetical protein SCHPADRAFT_828687 [Schizopora paradoxa]
MDQMRKRNPFKSIDDGVEQDDVRILDEQEQEEVIQELRRVNNASNNQFLIALRILVGISTFLRVLSFDSPQLILSLFLTIRTHDSPIILSRLFALLHTGVHLNVLLHLFTNSNSSPGAAGISRQIRLDDVPSWIADVPYLPLPFTWTFFLALLAPLTSIVSTRAWQQSAWWSTAFCLSLVSGRILAWISEGEESIRKLEGLQYNAKGA